MTCGEICAAGEGGVYGCGGLKGGGVEERWWWGQRRWRVGSGVVDRGKVVGKDGMLAEASRWGRCKKGGREEVRRWRVGD